MKILCSMTDSEFDKIKSHIDCHDWANPIEGEFVFYEPTERFVFMLALFDIEYHKTQQET